MEETEIKKYAKVCATCGKDFSASYPWSKNCSKECIEGWARRHQRTNFRNYYERNRERINQKSVNWYKTHKKKTGVIVPEN